jgi:YVTN family beta-propeller protein
MTGEFNSKAGRRSTGEKKYENQRKQSTERGFRRRSAGNRFRLIGPNGWSAQAGAATSVYVTNSYNNTVSVINAGTNTVTATVTVGRFPYAVAITPNGQFAYVANLFDKTVSVINTSTNTVTATVPVGYTPVGVAITPSVPFSAFQAKLGIEFGKTTGNDAFQLVSTFTPGPDSTGINPLTQPVTLQVGTFATTIPAGSFQTLGPDFYFNGTVNGVPLQVGIAPLNGGAYAFGAGAEKANLSGTTNPVPVALTIGDNTGIVSVNALIAH